MEAPSTILDRWGRRSGPHAGLCRVHVWRLNNWQRVMRAGCQGVYDRRGLVRRLSGEALESRAVAARARMASIIKSTAVAKLSGSSRVGRACAMAAVLGYWPGGRVR